MMVEVPTPLRSLTERLILPGGVLIREPGSSVTASPWPAVGLLVAGVSQTAIGMGLLLAQLATLIERHQALSHPPGGEPARDERAIRGLAQPRSR